MIKGAIFDLDGTLIDSMPMWTSLAGNYLRDLGKEPRENLTEKFKTFTLEQSAQYYRDHYGVEQSVEEIVQGAMKKAADFFENKVPLKSGVYEFLHKLNDAGVKMCVATMTPSPLAKPALRRNGVLDLFTGVYSASDIGINKEDPAFFRRVLEDFGTKAGETVMFEDSYNSLRTARAAGLICAGVIDSCEKNQEGLESVSHIYPVDFTDYETFESEMNRLK